MKRQRNPAKKALLQQATCPECWQMIHVHDNQTYFAHGKLRGEGQEPCWCSLSTRPIRPLFPLGNQILTIAAIEALMQARQDPAGLLHRHRHGDWGALSPEEARANVHNIQHNGRILSVYPLPGGASIWVSTEWDRIATTLLLIRK